MVGSRGNILEAASLEINRISDLFVLTVGWKVLQGTPAATNFISGDCQAMWAQCLRIILLLVLGCSLSAQAQSNLAEESASPLVSL